jgi:hypothetical protein
MFEYVHVFVSVCLCVLGRAAIEVPQIFVCAYVCTHASYAVLYGSLPLGPMHPNHESHVCMYVRAVCLFKVSHTRAELQKWLGCTSSAAIPLARLGCVHEEVYDALALQSAFSVPRLN